MYTYFDNRKCEYCYLPIPDQVSKSRKFCPREVMPDGSIKNCKDDFHSAKNRELENKLRRIGKFHRIMNERIEHLFIDKGENVLIQDLNKSGINLYRPIQFQYTNGMYKGWFLDYLIEHVNNNNFKISKHEQLF